MSPAELQKPARPNIVLAMADDMGFSDLGFRARYIRSGDWKMMFLSSDTTRHLYNLAKDKLEAVDLAAANPARVREMAVRWRQWAKENVVFSKPGRP